MNSYNTSAYDLDYVKSSVDIILKEIDCFETCNRDYATALPLAAHLSLLKLMLGDDFGKLPIFSNYLVVSEEIIRKHFADVEATQEK